MKIFSILCLACLALGCSTTHRGFSQPDLTKVRVGMTRQEVVKAMGRPDSVAVQGNTEYLEYGWDQFMDGVVGSAEWYYVRLIDGQVESYGRKGDFGTTVQPQQRQQIEIIQRPPK